MRLAFYRGPGDWITRVIRIVTRGPYSHVELVFSDGLRFGASGRRPAGVRLNSEPYGDGWDFIPLPIEASEERIARMFATLLAGSPFKWRGLFRFIAPFLGDGPNSHWYCSELVLWTLQRCFGMFEEVPLKISPNRLYALCCSELSDQ